MLKTISAALLAVSVVAAPAMAAGTGKTTHAPVVKTSHLKARVLNAHASMDRHHHHHYHMHVSHHRVHKG
jgi:hypothetical protein